MTRSTPSTISVIPAAGLSSRMGRPKLELMLGARSVLEHILTKLNHDLIEETFVILTPHNHHLAPQVLDHNARPILLSSQTTDMRTTVELGLLEVEQSMNCPDYFLLCPADYPAFSKSVVDQLLQATQTRAPIIRPSYQGTNGHPVVLAWALFSEIRALAMNQGINQVVKAHSDEVLTIPVECAGILRDIDTPQDYEELTREWSD